MSEISVWVWSQGYGWSNVAKFSEIILCVQRKNYFDSMNYLYVPQNSYFDSTNYSYRQRFIYIFTEGLFSFNQ